MKAQSILTPALFVFASACAADGSSQESATVADDETTDDGTDTGGTGAIAPCTIESSLGNLGNISGTEAGWVFTNAVTHSALVLSDAFYVAVDLVKREEDDPFPSGTIDLATQADIDTCTACVLLMRRSDGVALLATTGTLRVDALDVATLPGRYAATLTNVGFAQLAFDGDGVIEGDLLDGGCTTRTDGASFDISVVAAPSQGGM